jgi:hypothetical protein
LSIIIFGGNVVDKRPRCHDLPAYGIYGWTWTKINEDNMKTKTILIEIVIICCLVMSMPGTIDADDDIFLSCDNDGDPWLERICIAVKGGIHTKITISREDSLRTGDESDSIGSYILFDNKLDRDGILVFVSQPEFWHDLNEHDIAGIMNDSTAIWIPFPDIASGIFEIKLEIGKESYSRRLVIMK